MGVVKKVKADKAKLYDEFKKRNLSVSQVSKEMGRGPNYITEQIKQGFISLPCATFLKVRYNINEKDYAPEEETKPVVIEPTKTIDPIDYEKLATVIYDAVYEAVKKAWSE